MNHCGVGAARRVNPVCPNDANFAYPMTSTPEVPVAQKQIVVAVEKATAYIAERQKKAA